MNATVNKIKSKVSKSYYRYYNTITLNKNLIISGIGGFIASIIISHSLVHYSIDSILNSALTVITGFLIYKTIFAILFHVDNKQAYKKRFSKRNNLKLLKNIWIRIILVSSVFDGINNITRFALMSYLLNLDYSAIESTTISSMSASLLSYLVLNLVIKYFRRFSMKK